MLRLRRSIFTRLLSSPSASPISHLHRLLSAVSPSPGLNVEEYLVDRCGLTRAQAIKASAKISHLKSPTNPDAVLSFLAGLGLSTGDVSAVVAKDPKLLCSAVDKTLAPVVTGLAGLGVSRDEIARLVLVARDRIRCRSIVSYLNYYLPIFGSFHNLLRALKFNNSLLGYNLERTVKPNVTFLRECGLHDCDIAKLSIAAPSMLTNNLDRVRATVACAERLGVPRASPMFRHALHALAFDTEDTVAAKLDYLKKTFNWSDAEVAIAVSRAPLVLTRSKATLQGRSDFLMSEVGLEPAYIAHRSVILSYSLEGRLRPRYYVLKFLKENGLLQRERSYFSAVIVTEKVFVDRYICPHKEAAPHLAQDYATACGGQVPTRFRFA
jgi:mTERF domain-containing protein